MTAPVLWHFTCSHGHAGIGRRGLLLPNQHPWFGAPLVWLTSRPWPDRFATGLTHDYTACDRMAYRYRVTDPATCEAWLTSEHRTEARPVIVADLERYGDVAHW